MMRTRSMIVIKVSCLLGILPYCLTFSSSKVMLSDESCIFRDMFDGTDSEVTQWLIDRWHHQSFSPFVSPSLLYPYMLSMSSFFQWFTKESLLPRYPINFTLDSVNMYVCKLFYYKCAPSPSYFILMYFKKIYLKI